MREQLGAKLMCLVCFALLVSCNAGLDHVPANVGVSTTATPLQVKVQSARADMEETSYGALRTGTSTASLDFVSEDSTKQTVGVQFNQVGLPQGAKITSAKITFRAAKNDVGRVDLWVHAENSDNAETFALRARALSSRPKTAAKAAWRPNSWSKGQTFRTADLSSIIQEVVDREGWKAGNSLAFFISGNGNGKRSAYAYDGKPTFAPVLNVSYEMTEPYPREMPHDPLYGVVRSDPRRVESDWQAGIQSRTLELAWDAYERSDGVWQESYMSAKRDEYQTAFLAGFKVVIDLGLQYPPIWLLNQPNSRFVDQHGTAFTSNKAGSSQVNAVFNSRMRDYQARYVRKVFAELGADPYAVRLGWGWFGELGYPPVDYGTNSYWAFDSIAQGKTSGLPAGMKTSPIPGWRPPARNTFVTAETQHSAALFLEWYLDSLKNYHRWQIALLREVHNGHLFMLYPSFGVRPGQLEQAVKEGLSGRTAPEVNAEIQRGFDFARFVADIDDPLVSPYTTWLDADGWFVNDNIDDTEYWSPAHYLSKLAKANPTHLTVWGENTGNNRTVDLHLSFARVRQFGLQGMFWAFNSDLYSGGEVSIDDYASLIEASRLSPVASLEGSESASTVTN